MDLLELHQIEANFKDIPNVTSKHSVIGSHKFYHYKCDGADDIGWGCGYRTLQTICSWIRQQLIDRGHQQVKDVPSILEIQSILVECGDKPTSFLKSREWIGCYESSIVIDFLYQVPCRILHSKPGQLRGLLEELTQHFRTNPAPIMMGGDVDNASKGILGICETSSAASYLLVANPHYFNDGTEASTESDWIKWIEIDQLENTDSFYNFCVPKKIF